MTSYAMPSVGFASAAKKGNAMPFEQRVKIGMRRYKAALARKGGSITVRSEGDMVDFGVQHVYNRARDLGDNRKKVNGVTEFRRTIIEVVKRLLRTGACKHNAHDGRLILLEKTTEKKRVHVSKRPPFREVRTPRKYRPKP